MFNIYKYAERYSPSEIQSPSHPPSFPPPQILRATIQKMIEMGYRGSHFCSYRRLYLSHLYITCLAAAVWRKQKLKVSSPNLEWLRGNIWLTCDQSVTKHVCEMLLECILAGNPILFKYWVVN